MDFIWVPEPGPGNTSGGSSSVVANEFSLFLAGFVILACSAAAGSLLADRDVATLADKLGMGWVFDLVALFPWFGYLFVTAGALIGVSKSSAPIKHRLTWLAATQAVAAFLWVASKLH